MKKRKKTPPWYHGKTLDWETWHTEAEKECFTWIAAIKALEVDDPGPMLAELEQVVPRAIFAHFEDLFMRKKLVARKRGTPPTPSYGRTMANAWLETIIAPV